MSACIRQTWTAEKVDFLRAEYPRLSLAELTTAFNARFGCDVPESTIRGALRNHRIRSGRTGRFYKGQKSWNKGTNFMPGGRSVETRFKPGQRPASWVPVGTEVTDPDGFRKVKVRDDAPKGQSRFNWKFVHVLVWEEANGPVPSGHNVSFRDGNRQNCALENLVLLSREVNLQLNRNGYGEITDPELRRSMRHLARLKVKQYDVEKSHGLRKPGPGSKEAQA